MLLFDGQGAFPTTFRDLIRSLRARAISHVLVGKVAVHAFGGGEPERIEVCIRAADVERFHGEFAGREFEPLPGQRLRFYHPRTQIEVELVVAGEVAGDAMRQQEVRFPDPDEAEWIAGVPVVPLARLIELELAAWNERGAAVVQSLIATHELGETYAERLHPIVRAAFLESCAVL